MTELTGNRLPQEATGASGLERLGLSAEQLAALAQQGFLSPEDRGGKRPTYRLRFRSNGRQIVKYVGTDPAVVETIRREVTALQQAQREARELRQLVEEAHAVLRQTKRELQPTLEAAGMRFHGYAVRRARVKREE
jgi:hypothetical protein